MAQPAPQINSSSQITPYDVAARLYEKGFVTATLPRTEPGLAQAVADAYADSGIRLAELPARPADFKAIRLYLELITVEAERYGRSVECRRYQPLSMRSR